MRCPFCTQTRRDLFGLSLHLEDDHAELMPSVRVVVEASPLPIVEVDIDAIYTRRPDLVRAAPSRDALQH